MSYFRIDGDYDDVFASRSTLEPGGMLRLFLIATILGVSGSAIYLLVTTI